MMMKLWTVTHQECHLPQLTFFIEPAEPAETPPTGFSVILMSLGLGLPSKLKTSK